MSVEPNRCIASSAAVRRNWFGVVLTGISFGIALRFWFAVFSPVPPYTLNWTPLVYWTIGILFAGVATRIVWAAHVPQQKSTSLWLKMMNLAIFGSYLVPPAVFAFQAISAVNS